MLLVGIWQGKGSPPFLPYVIAFGEEMSHLYHRGIDVNILGSIITIKLDVFAWIVNLQA